MTTDTTTTRSQAVVDKAIDRVRKLLALAKGTSEHEAAAAASQAAALIERFALDEAAIRIDQPEAKPEPIERSGRLEPDLPTYGGRGSGRKRVAWKETLAKAAASDVGVKVYWRNHVDICGFGRESAIATWRYTYQYLCRAVDELADAGWESASSEAWESARAWKNAFRVGCAQRIATRIFEARVERQRAARRAAHAPTPTPTAEPIEASRESLALAIVARDQAEVDQAYAEYSRAWTGTIGSIGSTSSGGGYAAGRAAGDSVRLGGGGRGLGAGQGRLRGGRS